MSYNSDDKNILELMQSIQKLMIDLEDNPDNYNLIVQAGNAYFDIQKYNQAIKYYTKANHIRINENVLIDLGVCYFNLGKLDSALIVMQKALNHNPEHKQGLYNIGIVLYNSGQLNRAVDNWEYLIQTHPNTQEAIRVQQYINEINSHAKTGT